MINLRQREARSPHPHVRTRSGAVSAARPPSACARQTQGHALSLPAARRQGAFLSSHGLRTWRSPSRSEGERQPRRGTWFPVSGCSGHGGSEQLGGVTWRCAEWRRPSVLPNWGAFSRCRAGGDARRVNDHGISYRPTRRSFGTTRCSARRPNKTQDHSHGLTGENPGLFRAGNDRNARQAGLQEDGRPRVKAVQARCPQIAMAVWPPAVPRSTRHVAYVCRASRISHRRRSVVGGA